MAICATLTTLAPSASPAPPASLASPAPCPLAVLMIKSLIGRDITHPSLLTSIKNYLHPYEGMKVTRVPLPNSVIRFMT